LELLLQILGINVKSPARLFAIKASINVLDQQWAWPVFVISQLRMQHPHDS
jgi:uncharacterized protein (DUF849 family)